eukprot:5204655-Alexandrium_andersonii.AAC.1
MAIRMALWPPQKGCAAGGVGLSRYLAHSDKNGPLAPPRRAAQWGVGMSRYVTHSDKNGPLASPEGLHSG